MRNFWLIARNEYLNTVVRRGFLILTLAIPLGMAALIGLSIAAASVGENNQPLGYVDQSGILDPALHRAMSDADERVQIREFDDVETAQAALERGEIQAFVLFPETYPGSLQTELFYQESPPDDGVMDDMNEFVRVNLLSSLPAGVQERLLAGPSVTIHDVDNGRTFSQDDVVQIVLPFVATFFFFFATMSSAGYMLSVVAGEKENRTVEVMLTTVTPGQLIGGKTIGLLAASLTQLAIYVVAAVIGLQVAAPYVPELQGATMPWGYLGMMALFFFPSYALIAGIMVAIGAAVTEVQQGQQIAGILNLLFVSPLFLLPLIFENPSSPVVTAFTLFPTTAFLTTSLRWGLGTVPLWQMGLSWVILVATALAAIWAAARIFRAGMLRYGQPLSLEGIVAAVRGTTG
jgi:ABC-2 type transport system permease protein